MKKQQGPLQKTMLQALQELRTDGQTKSAAYYFLKADLSMLQTEESFRKAYHGLLCCLQLLGPMHPDYQKSLTEMRKALDGFARRFQLKELHEAKEFRATVTALWAEILDEAKRHFPSREWFAFSKLGTEIFGKEH